jgi:hypothetical protein
MWSFVKQTGIREAEQRYLYVYCLASVLLEEYVGK